MTADKQKKEAEALKLRRKAIALLQSEGESMRHISKSLYEADKNKNRDRRDNTLELLMKDKCESEYQKVAGSLSRVASSVATSAPVVSVPPAAKESSSVEADEPLPSNWERVPNPNGKTPAYYFWNKETNETTWTRPANIVSEWMECVHESSNQKYWKHSVTGEKRWTPFVANAVESKDTSKRSVEIAFNNNDSNKKIRANNHI